MNTGNQLNSTVSSICIWDLFSSCLLMCTLLRCTLSLQSVASSSSLDAHTVLLMEIEVQVKGESGKERTIFLSWWAESWLGCLSGITHHLKHHPLAVKSQAGELVASLQHYKQGEEEANWSESRFGAILSWWSPLILKRLVRTSYIFSVKHFKIMFATRWPIVIFHYEKFLVVENKSLSWSG